MKGRLNWHVMAALVFLSFLWGSSMAVVKVGGREMAPFFMAGTRSFLAALCLFAWLKWKGMPLFPSGRILLHGMVVGALFALEFGLLYQALEITTASRAYILTYTSPFFVALLAHFMLKDDRLDWGKAGGLILAFSGVTVLFIKDAAMASLGGLPGDMLALAAGLAWALTTVYLKRYLVSRVAPLQTLFYQVFFSAPLLLAASVLWEDSPVFGLTWAGVGSLAFQSFIVAFLSYLAWFELIHRHPVSLLHAFAFLTPIFGVFFSGYLFMGEELTPRTLVALGLVTVGLALVNRVPNSARAVEAD